MDWIGLCLGLLLAPALLCACIGATVMYMLHGRHWYLHERAWEAIDRMQSWFLKNSI